VFGNNVLTEETKFISDTGRPAVAGERGPEGVLPLGRDQQTGELGVKVVQDGQGMATGTITRSPIVTNAAYGAAGVNNIENAIASKVFDEMARHNKVSEEFYTEISELVRTFGEKAFTEVKPRPPSPPPMRAAPGRTAQSHPSDRTKASLERMTNLM
jgi:hypothetical protein